ncbi:aspartic peptidase domain-containing protein [Xylariaceae sp. FL0255]|nr:aspartic peptidase domain-containing protein [Xylariaceae sp. FL0255]
MTRHRLISAVIFGTLLTRSPAHATEASALWFEPSLSWYGIDGNWSSTTLFVGEPAQQVQVIVSTSLSEVWVIDDGGCDGAICDAARGGVYNTSASSSWASMGEWQLGLKAIGIEANGDYAMETVVIYDSVKRWQTSLQKLLVAAINTTTPYTGFFGLGMTPGNFNGTVAASPIADIVERSGIIPSHSYGFTAGAYYGSNGGKGTPMSLTLGGYDANRFVPHDVTFNLNTTCNQPDALVRAITASVSDASKAPASWSSSSVVLSAFNESVTALIDSSTPYLWLPADVCDRFASAFNLTWNETYGLYLFSDTDHLEEYQSLPDLSLAFTLSSSDDKNNFGSPTNMSGVVNITISGNAFVQSLSYPFMDIPYGAAAVPYFPLKRVESGNLIVLGRSFLQESYLILDYETSTFSVHQALFPDDPERNTSIQTIAASPNSPYPKAAIPASQNSQGKMDQNEIAGVVVGLCAASIGIVTTLILVRRKRRRAKIDEDETKEYHEKSSSEPLPPTCPVSALNPCKKRKLDSSCKDPETAPHEVGADFSHERYEMPATLPVELDATGTNAGAYIASRAGDERLSQDSYERPQRWADLSQTGLAEDAVEAGKHSRANFDHDLVSPIDTHFRSRDSIHELSSPSPSLSPIQGSTMDGMPSPMTISDSSTFPLDIPSPIVTLFPTRSLSSSARSMTFASPPQHGTMDAPRLSRSASALTPPTTLSVQRTPIDTTEIVCLGPLPDNVRLPRPSLQRPPPPAQFPGLPTIASVNPSRRQSTADTLGSNFTLEEEEEGRVAATVVNEDSAFRRMDGFDIVHVPQMAHRRYSWEE